MSPQVLDLVQLGMCLSILLSPGRKPMGKLTRPRGHLSVNTNKLGMTKRQTFAKTDVPMDEFKTRIKETGEKIGQTR